MNPTRMLDHVLAGSRVRVAAPRHGDAEALEVRHRLGHLQRRGEAVDDGRVVDARDACARDRFAEVELPGNDRVGASSDRTARRDAKLLDQGARVL